MPEDPSDEAMKAEVNRLIAYHEPITKALNVERTALESKLIPVSAYIVTACVEAFLRYPEMMRQIAAARAPEEIGAAARRPGCRVNTVHLWSIANFWLIGRKVWAAVDPAVADAVPPAHEVLHFWERAATGFRADGTRQAWDTGTAAIYGPEWLAQLEAGLQPVDEATRSRIKRANATLVTYLFLLYFDTRVGSGDTGPYPLPDGRQLLVRDFYNLRGDGFWWGEPAQGLPYRNLTAAFVLDGARVTRISDFGTSTTDPEDYLDHVRAFGLYTPDTPDGSLRPVSLDELDSLVTDVRRVQASLYRAIAAMDRDEKIRCGAHVYFTFLRPFAELAGVADQLDWTVPRDIPPPLYELVSQMDGANAPPGDEPYYDLVP